MRGYIQGHETGAAASSITADIVRELQADAWNLGHHAGADDAATSQREDIADVISDLAARYADIDTGFKRLAYATREQRITRELADMEAVADRIHATTGTQPWAGLENGAILPSADWVPDTTELARKAAEAAADAPNPVLTNWADVRAYVDDRTWNRILGDLQPATRAEAIRQAGSQGTGAAA